MKARAKRKIEEFNNAPHNKLITKLTSIPDYDKGIFKTTQARPKTTPLTTEGPTTKEAEPTTKVDAPKVDAPKVDEPKVDTTPSGKGAHAQAMSETLGPYY